jgi:LPS-assembly lipoprotein
LFFKLSLLVFFHSLLSACGFQPLYGTKGSENILYEFSNIHITPTSDRIGQLLSNELKYLLNPLNKPVIEKYRLITTITSATRSLAVKKTALATRSNLTVTSSYKLIDISTQKLLYNSSNTILVSYNIFTSQYATLSAEKDAKSRAVKELAQDIRIQIGAYFNTIRKLNIVP